MDIRRAVGATVGIPREKLDDLLRHRESDRFTAREQVALEYAERITRDDRDVSDGCLAHLREHFSEAEVVELTFHRGIPDVRQQVREGVSARPAGIRVRVNSAA